MEAGRSSKKGQRMKRGQVEASVALNLFAGPVLNPQGGWSPDAETSSA
jgi:hypothetical protein